MPLGGLETILLPAAVSGISSLLGSKRAAKGATDAAAIEAAAAKEALDFEKQKYTETQTKLAAQWDAYQQERAPYVKNALAILAKYNPGAAASAGAPAAASGTSAPPTLGAAAGLKPTTTIPAASSLGDLSGLSTAASVVTPDAAMSPALMAPRATIASLAGWNKWGA